VIILLQIYCCVCWWNNFKAVDIWRSYL